MPGEDKGEQSRARKERRCPRNDDSLLQRARISPRISLHW
jgi:hypothetical protein